jgi:predicted ATPase/class 3 adenylate cyclase
MRFSELVDQASEFLRRRERATYRALKREFDLDDGALEDLKAELIDARRVARDEEGKVLVWGGNASVISARLSVVSSSQPSAPQTPSIELRTQDPGPQALNPRRQTLDASAERRQLTVMFCDLVGSTALSARLDPEELREVVRQYQQTCAEAIYRHEGYIAQYLGDGLLVYFGYPTAHEDDARRAVRAGLEILEALRRPVPSPTRGEGQGEGLAGARHAVPLQVRVGIHTGLVVIGDIGAAGRTEQLALGETPNVAARIQGLAEPNTVLISAATQRLIAGHFECQPLGSRLVKGIDTPIAVYHVQGEWQSASPLAPRTTLTPLVGREQEVGLLIDRWEQAKEGRGQVVLLSGEPGIGKSRLAYTLREHVTREGSLLFEARCSPYHQHSALYPLIDALQRTLLFTGQDTNDEKVRKLDRALALYGMQESLPLFTALLSLPAPPQYPPLHLTPQKQKERTLQALAQLLVAQAERRARVSVWEDLHWADPSSSEFLSLLIDQIPTTKLLLVLTFRPEFTPSWKSHSHISQLVLNRLGEKQAEAMIEKVTAGAELSAEVIDQIRIKTDGVPLFVEELTKAVLEAGGAGARRAAPLQIIPATLQEALLARLDRLSAARRVAQLGATLGREFSYELLHAVAPVDETDLRAALAKLVEAEILYQRGIGQQARYFFKHALIQDTAYQSLLKSTRQQHHQQIARVLEEGPSDTKEAHPELLAHHYTEASLIEQAIPYWQQAGQKANQRSAYIEAISHLTRGLEVLKLLPDTPARSQQELLLQITLGTALMATQGYAAPEVEQAYTRARELCQQLGDTGQLFPVLVGLLRFYSVSAKHRAARDWAEQLLGVAQRTPDHTGPLLGLHQLLGNTLLYTGEPDAARMHLEHAMALYNSRPQRHRRVRSSQDAGVVCLGHLAWALWGLGYPTQASQKLRESLTLARELGHPLSLCWVQCLASIVYQFLGSRQEVRAQSLAAVELASEHGFTQLLAQGIFWRGWLQAGQGRGIEAMAQMEQGIANHRATGAEVYRPYLLGLLAEACGEIGQIEKACASLTDALDAVDKTEERFYEAELYRLKGALTLQSQTRLGQVSNTSQTGQEHSARPQPLTPSAQEAEACFLKAIEISRKQRAKSLELRAATSLARLWQQQGNKIEAHKLLSEVYNWFTEGFDTKDLQEAKRLLDELAEG